MELYDFIIAGGGASGLSLAFHLARSPLRGSSILIVDRAPQGHEHRTWCFWTDRPTPFDAIVSRSWNRLLVATDRTLQIRGLGPYQYKLIRGDDFYRFTREQLSRLPNVEFLQGRVEAVKDGDSGASVFVDGREYAGRWVFDSRFRLADFHPDPGRFHYLKMQFRGWEIETDEDAFDPATGTFLDFRTPQRGRMRFLHALPYSERRALVEYVVATRKLLHREEIEEALRAYIADTLGIKRYQVLAREQGVNPMTDYLFQRRRGCHVMTIGVPGGMLKPTTGFAFTRIQRDSAAIVRSLLEHGHPFDVPASAWAYRLYESLMLHVMFRYGERVGSLLSALFKYGSTPHILRFLDEAGPPF
jgi:lycopene beta-cyclase